MVIRTPKRRGKRSFLLGRLLFFIYLVWLVTHTFIATELQNKESKKNLQPLSIGNNNPYCACVNCGTDKACGLLWRTGNQYSVPLNPQHFAKKVHVVISHCKNDLSWVRNLILKKSKFHVESIHVITKCGYNVTGAPAMATVEVLPNIGRCDHSYAHYITKVLDKKVKEGEEDDSVVLFLKDDVSEENKHQKQFVLVHFNSMVHMASSANGFQCRLQIKRALWFNKVTHLASTYHDTKMLSSFNISEYQSSQKNYTETDQVQFKSKYKNLGAFHKELFGSDDIIPDVVPVCYGGVFAASFSNIKQHSHTVWKFLEKALNRGNNIEEGHFAERSWAMLLSPPLEQYKVKGLLDYSSDVMDNEFTPGILLRRLFLSTAREKITKQLASRRKGKQIKLFHAAQNQTGR